MQNGLRKRITKNPDQVARALGWFSVGLGLSQILVPRAVGRLVGVRPRPWLFRLFGLRELASGIGILSQSQKSPWLKARVAGDAIDLLSLGAAMTGDGTRKGSLALSTAAVAGVTAVDVLCSVQMSSRPFRKGQPLRVRKSITISRSPNELYTFWRNFEQLPTFMNHLLSVRQLEANRSHWIAKGPAGVNVEWDAQIVADQPDSLIAWRSLDGSDVDNSGEVRFEPATGDRGTVVRVDLQYNPPAGKVGAAFAKILGEAPEKQIAVDLLRFKQLMETGEIARTEGQPAGRRHSTSRKYDDLVRS